MTLLIERILESAERAAPRVAMIADGRVFTYRNLLALISTAARVFHEKGVRAGDIVGLGMGQSPLHLVAFLALARIGAVALPQYPNIPAAQRSRALERYGARWLVTDLAVPAEPRVPVIVMRDLRARGDERDFGFTDFRPSAGAPLRIALTSGTAGDQKACLHTHGDFSLRLARRFDPADDAPRVIPPLLHITAALQLACHALASGGAVVFPRSNDARAFLDAIHLHAVTHVNLPPADLAALCAMLPEEAPAFPTIRRLKVAGATPSVELLRVAKRKFSPHVFASYSMTEVGMVASADAALLESAPGTAGRVCPDAGAEAVDDEGRVLPRGTVGELRVKVDGMPGGYYGPDASLPGFRDGWFHAGDRGRVTADGLVYVEGRADDLMNIGGHKVAPEFIESILARHGGVAEAAAFPMQDGMSGARVGAAIVTRAALDWNALSAFARTELGQSAPVRYFRVASLPRNAMGKIERQALADWVASHGEPATGG